MNDVAFGNWRGNYANFIGEVGTPEKVQTRGWWREGMSNSSFFGRFARGWKDPTDASATMALKIDAGMWGGLPLSSSSKAVSNLTMRLVFLDQGQGQFTIHYDTGAAAADKAVVVRKKGSGEWRELCVPLSSPRFGGGGPSGADLWITNDDATDDIFDSLEISELGADEIAMASCNWETPDSLGSM